MLKKKKKGKNRYVFITWNKSYFVPIMRSGTGKGSKFAESLRIRKVRTLKV